MTLGCINFEMALHLPSSTQHHEHHHHHHDLHQPNPSIGGLHSHNHHLQQHPHQQHHHQHQHGYNNGSSSYPIKYEPCEQASSNNAISSGIGGDDVHSFLLHHQQQQLSSTSSSTFENSNSNFFDSNPSMNSGSDRIIMSQHHQQLGTSDCDESDLDGDSESPEKLLHRQQLRALGRSNSSSSSNNLDRKRPYPCKVCPSKFGSKMELEEHQNSHTGQKPFECEVCKSRFNRRSTLWNHKRIHSDAKPFVCTVCHMQFKWKNSLKCHKEMHVRKNETPSIGDADNDIRQLTYATAAKRRMLEIDGTIDSSQMRNTAIFSASSVPPAASTSSGSSSSNESSTKASNNNGNGNRKKQKLIKKESIKNEPLDLIQTPSFFSNSSNSNATVAATNEAQQFNLLMNNQAMRKLTFGNLDFDNSQMSRDFGADLHLDTNLDLINNPLWMQLWNNAEGMDPINQLDFRSNTQNNSLFGMDDPSKVLTGGIFDLKDSLGLHSPNGANQLSMALLPKPMLNMNIDFNRSATHPNLPAINHLTASATFSDYSTHDNSSLTSQFHLAQNQSTASSSSTPSSNGHQPNGHLNSDLTYQQPLDHALLLNTNHANDYMIPMEYLTPTGNHLGGASSTTYSSHDLPLSAFTSTHDPLEHSPHSSSIQSTSAASIFYPSSLGSSDLHHHQHSGCLSQQMR